ncbi:MAG: hypothetical protein KA385_17795 [Vicinamibacteria bacterium]|nr:hypothetical protein [Vicinamibacteria bacterium]
MDHPRSASAMRRLVLLLGLSGYVIIGVAAVLYPYDLGMYEGVVFAPALDLVAGNEVFGAGAALTPPYSFPLYGPLYYLGLGAALNITGVAFWPGRLLSFACGLGLMGLVWRYARRVGLDGNDRWLLANLFMMLPSAWTFFTLQRVDAPSLLLAALGATLILERHGRRAAFVSGVLFALAALTKPAICGLFLGSLALRIIEKRRIEAALCALGAGITFIGSIEALDLLGSGHYLFNLFASLEGENTVAGTQRLLKSIGGSPVMFVLSTFGFIEMLRELSQKERVADFGPICLALASLMSGALLAAHTGSSMNYLLETFFALTLLVARSLGTGALRRTASPGLPAMILLAAFGWESLVFHGGFIRGRLVLPLENKLVFEAIVGELRGLPAGSVVIGDLPDLVLRAGQRPWVNDMPQYDVGPAYLQRTLAKALLDHRVAGVLTYSERPIRGFRQHRLPPHATDPQGATVANPGPFLYLRDVATGPGSGEQEDPETGAGR